MKRLTERLSNGQVAVFGCGNNCEYDYKYCNNHLEDCPTINKIYEKLARYEDLQEQGKLLKLPCVIGDIVYDVVLCDDEKYRIFKMKVCNINPFGGVRRGKVWNVYLEDNYTKAYRGFDDFGKTVFSTKREAAQALERMEDRNEK